MPSLNDLGRVFASITTADILIGLTVTASILVLVSDWRISLLALAVQYILVTVLFSTLIPLPVATVRMIAGGLVATIMYLTARRMYPRRKKRDRDLTEPIDEKELEERGAFAVSLAFRLIALVLVGVTVITVSGQFSLLNALLLFMVTGLWLCSTGLLLIALTRDVLKLGTGLLTFTLGFGILYLSIDQSLLIYGVLILSDLVIGLVIAHLASVPQDRNGRRKGEAF